MRFYFYRTPSILKKIFKGCTWRRPTSEKVIYLTFDDGPVPGATEWVLNTLQDFNAKATFFMVGHNIKKYPEVFKRVVAEGHAVGNHTYHHIKGWNSSLVHYQENIRQCQKMIEQHTSQQQARPLFRPPYGRITNKQIKELSKSYEVVMWQILSGDFDMSLNQDSSWGALQKTKAGDIVVFHDSQKYLKNVQQLLPKYLTHFTQLGYTFEPL